MNSPPQASRPQGTPEHDKQSAVWEKSQTIREFLEWLEGEEIYLCRPGKDEDGIDQFFPVTMGTSQLLAKYFSIDLKKIAEELDQMLEEYRQTSQNRITS